MVETYSLLLLIVAMGVAGFLVWRALALWISARGRRTGSGVAESQRRSFEDALDVELERARRHERPLTIVRIVVAPRRPADLTAPGQPAVARRTDRAFDVGSASYLIAPETDVVESTAIRRRIRTALGDPKDLLMSAVTFPDDGVSSGSLLSELDRRGRHGRQAQSVGITDRRPAGRRSTRSRPRHRSAS